MSAAWRRGAALAFAALASLGARGEVTAREAWVRGTVPAQKSTGAFMTLTSSEDAKLVGVATPAAKRIEIHTSSMQSGVVQMQALEAIDLPAGKPVQLRPGGHHLMLLGLTGALREGERVPLVLTIEGRERKRTQVEVKAVVRPLGAR